MTGPGTDFIAIYDRLDTIAALSDDMPAHESEALAAEQLALAEAILETWVTAHDGTPTTREKEGFRLLALHSQGAKGDPSFNACRESCREAVFQHNVVMAANDPQERARALKLMTMVVRHLALFISGKLEVTGLGEFCCASKSLRAKNDSMLVPTT